MAKPNGSEQLSGSVQHHNSHIWLFPIQSGCASLQDHDPGEEMSGIPEGCIIG